MMVTFDKATKNATERILAAKHAAHLGAGNVQHTRLGPIFATFCEHPSDTPAPFSPLQSKCPLNVRNVIEISSVT